MHSLMIREVARIPPGLVLSLFLVLGSGCYQVPVTGRTALNTVSDEAVNKMSLQAYEHSRSKPATIGAR